MLLSAVAFCICPGYDSSGSDAGSGTGAHSATSGLVGDFQFTCVPAVPASFSMLVVVVMTLPLVWKIMFEPHFHSAGTDGGGKIPTMRKGLFVKSVVYSAMTLFMFGYHVHEKAILVALVPMTMILAPSSAVDDSAFANELEKERWHAVYLQVSAAGVTSLLPLLMNREELALKGILCFGFLVGAHVLVSPACGRFYSRINLGSIIALCFLFIFNEIVHPILFWNEAQQTLRYPFLPLLLYSSVCSLMLLHAYLLMILALFQINVFGDDQRLSANTALKRSLRQSLSVMSLFGERISFLNKKSTRYRKPSRPTNRPSAN